LGFRRKMPGYEIDYPHTFSDDLDALSKVLGPYWALLLFNCQRDSLPHAFALSVILGCHPGLIQTCLRYGVRTVEADHAVSRAVDAFGDIVRHAIAPWGRRYALLG